MLKLLYFANLRENLGVAAEESALPHGVNDVRGLLMHLAARGGAWAEMPATKNLRCAINQDMARLDSPIKDGDEIAFFPPVTGG